MIELSAISKGREGSAVNVVRYILHLYTVDPLSCVINYTITCSVICNL
jgi:hypothetical protein